MRLLVVGGNGFLGAHICRKAAQLGLQAVALSRTGPTAAHQAQEWSKAVEWVRGDALQASTFKDLLNGCAAVVHAAGTLLEADYKWLLRGTLPAVLSPRKTAARQQSYEQANYETAKVLLDEAEIAGVGTYVYVSADSAPPLVDQRYIRTKRDAEKEILDVKSIRSVILRPSAMYSEDRPLTYAIALANGLAAAATLAPRPIRVETVADAAVQAVLNPSASGIYRVPEIEKLALQANRVRDP